MARLQILELPRGSGDDRPPFVLVVDQVTEDEGERLIESQDVTNGFAVKVGARAVVAFHGMTMEIPANDTAPVTVDDPEQAGITQIVYAHERTRLDLCDALLLDSGTTWCKLIDHVAERQQELAGLYRKLDARAGLIALEPRTVALVRKALAINLTVATPSDVEGALHSACRELEKSEAARAHLRREREALTARLRQVQEAPTTPDVMNAQQERPEIWRHGYECGVRAAKAAARPRDEKASGS